VPAVPISLASKNNIPPFPLRKFKVMLCDCWVSIKSSETYDKLAPRRIKGVHLGYDARRQGYFVWLPELLRITTASDVEFCEDVFTQLTTVRANVKILKRAHNKELPEVLPVTAAAAGLGGELQHARATGARARAAATAAPAATAAAAAAASDASSPAAVPAPPPTACRHASRPTYAAPARAAAPPPPPAPPSPPPPRAPAGPHFDGPSGRTRSASASLVVDVPAYELEYLQDKHDYDYKPAGSFASNPAGSMLLVGSVMGEAYKVDVDVGIVPIPRSHAAAIADPVYGAKWRAACDDDFEGKYTLLKTWELVKSVARPARHPWQVDLRRQVQAGGHRRQVQGALRRLRLQPGAGRRLHQQLLQHAAPREPARLPRRRLRQR